MLCLAAALSIQRYLKCLRPMLARRNVASEFAKAHPLTIRSLAGDAFTLSNWGTTRNLHTALAKKFPSELGDDGGGCGGPRPSFELRAVSDNTVISPEYGGPGRQRLLSGAVGCDELVLTFTTIATGSPPVDEDRGHSTALRMTSVTDV